MITKEQFIQFLKDEGCYEKYVANFKNYKHRKEPMDNYIDRAIKDELYCILLSTAFIWSKTPEGVEYWNEIAIKFDDKLNLK